MCAVKIKNDTSEMVAETARRLGVPRSEIQNEFQFFWIDLNIVFNNFIGHSVSVDHFCHFFLRMDGVKSTCKYLEKRFDKHNARYKLLLEKQDELKISFAERIADIEKNIARTITKIILYRLSLKEYEQDVLSKYPKKYRPDLVHIEKLIARLEKHYNISISKFPLQIDHPIQKIFVQSLQGKGLLPNPVFYKDKPMQ